MVDLHCHILPGLDDGPATMEESMGMAESAIADGITHLVATPHSSNRYSFDFARVRQLREDRKSTRLNSSHLGISYAVFCLKKKKHEIRDWDAKRIDALKRRVSYELRLRRVQASAE